MEASHFYQNDGGAVSANAPKPSDVYLDRMFYCGDSGDLTVDGVIHSEDWVALLRWRSVFAHGLVVKASVVMFCFGAVLGIVAALASNAR